MRHPPPSAGAEVLEWKGSEAKLKQLAKVIRPDIPAGRRVIAVSDIHGNLPFLKGVLDKAGFSPADVLVLVGDLFEKGEDSLGLLRYLLELGQTHTVYPLCGNCDHVDKIFLAKIRPSIDQELWPVFRRWGRRSLILQLAAQLGLEARGPEDLPAIRQAILERFPRESRFLLELPHILAAGRYLFVHGGLPREDRLEELEAYGCMKNDDFLGQGLSFQKWVVVGHWPVTLYNPSIPTARPLICRERHIASIDGGCVLKLDGQLNALIIPDVYGDEMDYVAYDGLPTVVAEEDQQASQDSLNIRWSDSAVQVLREEGDCCWCRHLSTGRELWILKEYLYTRLSDGTVHCEDTTDYLLPVSAGERLKLVRRSSRGCLVKKQGMTGWYRGRLRE